MTFPPSFEEKGVLMKMSENFMGEYVIEIFMQGKSDVTAEEMQRALDKSDGNINEAMLLALGFKK